MKLNSIFYYNQFTDLRTRENLSIFFRLLKNQMKIPWKHIHLFYTLWNDDDILYQ